MKYQQSQLATPPSRALGAGTSSGIPHAPTIVDRPIAEEDGRRIPGLNYASVSRQRNSIATDSAITRENNMLSNPNMMGRSSGSSWRPVVSSSREGFGRSESEHRVRTNNA